MRTTTLAFDAIANPSINIICMFLMQFELYSKSIHCKTTVFPQDKTDRVNKPLNAQHSVIPTSRALISRANRLFFFAGQFLLSMSALLDEILILKESRSSNAIVIVSA